MPKSEDGEFELILGNRQLLSVFFIVVILLGVFFTMGYIVGRNSAPMAAQEIAPVRRVESKPLVVESPNPEPPPSQPPQETAEPPKREPVPVEAASNRTPEPENQPGPGQTYLQLAATSQREADILVDVLRRKAFKARAAEVPDKPGMFRVLVGPVEDGAINKTRSELQGAGFPGNAAIPRRF